MDDSAAAVVPSVSKKPDKGASPNDSYVDRPYSLPDGKAKARHQCGRFLRRWIDCVCGAGERVLAGNGLCCYLKRTPVAVGAPAA